MKSIVIKHRLTEEENPFAMSIGDLMAALLLIFILLLSSALLSIREQVEDYGKSKEEIYEELMKKFKDKLDIWKAEINPETLTVSFHEPEIYFEEGKSDLKLSFKKILDEFFAEYIEVLYRDTFRSSIEEIRIEGHTSSEWYRRVDLPAGKAYFLNMELSQARTRSVVEYCLSKMGETETLEKAWVREKIAAIGLSSSKLKHKPGTIPKQEWKEASRRVEFRVRTDAEARIRKLTFERNNKRPLFDENYGNGN
jgi:outer membrane protein OmpA-like peptidoglycan-associated protein